MPSNASIPTPRLFVAGVTISVPLKEVIPSNVPALISAVLATNPAPKVTAPGKVPPEDALTVSDTVKLL